MATPERQSIDDMIMTMVSMGFELDDAQQAVQIGKLSVEEAIEWIVAGKPVTSTTPAVSSQPRLRLNRAHDPGSSAPTIGANPFLNPQPLSTGSTSQGGSVVSDGGVPLEATDELVKSRVNRNEEQRLVKERFEAKKREEARRQAKLDKLSAKKAHEAVLKEIAYDREKQRMKKQAAAAAASSSSSSPPPPQPAASPVSPATTPASPDKCLLQVRLPKGQPVRGNFTAQTTLREVWDFVQSKWPEMDGYCLMQPFPRQDYTEEHMTLTMADLKLVPSGSLVLKKLETTQAQPASEAMHVAVEEDQATATVPAPPVLNNASQLSPLSPPPAFQIPPTFHQPVPGLPPINQPLPGMPPINPLFDEVGAGLPGHPGHHAPSGHQWGAGHLLQADGDHHGNADNVVGEAMEEEAPAVGGPQLHPPVNEMDVEDDDDEDVPADEGIQHFDPNLAMGWGNVQQGHQWGDGNRLIGEVLNVDNLPHHRKDPKRAAAEAAAERFAHAPQMDVSEASTSSAPLFPAPPRLTQLIIDHISGRICDTRHPITGLQGLPADLAMMVLDHLIKERLLKPRTLHPFVSCRLRKVVLDCYPYTTNELVMALRLHTYLTHLSMGSCPLITDKGLVPLKMLKRLKYLSLMGCQQVTDNIFPILKNLENLVTLILEGTSITDEGTSSYLSSAPESLQHLSIGRSHVTHNVLPALSDPWTLKISEQHGQSGTFALPNLRSLSLEDSKVSSLTGMQNLCQIQSLNLSGTPIVTESLLCLAKLTNLTALNIANTPNLKGDLALEFIKDLKLHSIQLPSRLTTSDRGIEFLRAMPLHTLDLTNYIHVGDDAAQHIGQISSMKKLHLSNTKISDVGLVFLSGLTALEELDLNRTLVTDDGLTVIQSFTKLQELGLSETGITNQLLQQEVLNSCRVLSKLNLSRTSVSNKGVSKLSLPYLTLLNLDGTRVRSDIGEILTQSCRLLQHVSLVNILAVRPEDEDDV